MIIVLLSSAAANIFNKKFLTGTNCSIVQFALFAYLFALAGSMVLFLGENLVRYQTIKETPLSLVGITKAEEVLNVILLNSVNEIATYIMMMYLARKTYIARASVFGILASLYVIIEGVSAGRMGSGNWWWIVGTYLEIVLFLASYALIFFERVQNKNKAKFQKVERTVKYLKEVGTDSRSYEAHDFRDRLTEYNDNYIKKVSRQVSINPDE